MSYFLWKEGKDNDAPILVNVYDTQLNCLKEMNKLQKMDKDFNYFIRGDEAKEATSKPKNRDSGFYIPQPLLQKMAALVGALVG